MLSGRVHNAKKVTIDGRDCWIGAVHRDGRFTCRAADIQECGSVEEARTWLRGRLAQLGEPDANIVVERDENERG